MANEKKAKSEDQYTIDRANLIDKIGQLQTIMSKSYYSTWVDFSIGDFRIVQTNDKKKNSMVSCEHARTGVGKANTFTIVCAFEPDPKNLDKINEIEKEIGYNYIKNGKACKLRYGYIQGDRSLISPQYECMLMGYKIEVRDGILYYTFTGNSSVVETKELKVNTESYMNKRPTEAVKEEMEKVFQSVSSMQGWKVVIDKTVTDHPDGESEEIAGGEFGNIFDYAKDTLAQAKPESETVQIAPAESGKANSYGKSNKKVEEEKKEEKTEDHSTYEYVINDSKKEVRIIRYDPKDKKSVPKADIKFNWMSRDGIVQDFRTEFDGVLLFNKKIIEEAINEKEKEESVNPVGSLFFKEDWKTILNDITKNDTFASSGAEMINEEQWRKATDVNYTATMTTVGMPFEEIEIATTMFKIVPLIYGRAHFTQGDYMVTGIRDIIDANGYTTSFQLMRVGGQDE